MIVLVGSVLTDLTEAKFFHFNQERRSLIGIFIRGAPCGAPFGLAEAASSFEYCVIAFDGEILGSTGDASHDNIVVG